MKLNASAIRTLCSGRPIAAEVPATDAQHRRWVAVHPYVRGGPGGKPYRGVGAPSLDVHDFEARRTSLEAGHDVAGELKNQRRHEIEPRRTFEDTLEALEACLMSLGLDPSALDEPDDEFPL